MRYDAFLFDVTGGNYPRYDCCFLNTACSLPQATWAFRATRGMGSDEIFRLCVEQPRHIH